jgi:hypothetical protein
VLNQTYGLQGMARVSKSDAVPRTLWWANMQKCSICGRKSIELYPVDDHAVCEVCLLQGRLDELPEIASADRLELELVGTGTTLSSWWNREVPEQIAHVS